MRFVRNPSRIRSKWFVLPPHLQSVTENSHVSFMANDYDCADAMRESIVSEDPRCLELYCTLLIVSEERVATTPVIQPFSVDVFHKIKE